MLLLLFEEEFNTRFVSNDLTLFNIYSDVLTSMSTRTLEMNMNIILRASSSSNERAKQPFSLHSSTAKQHVKDSTQQIAQNDTNQNTKQH